MYRLKAGSAVALALMLAACGGAAKEKAEADSIDARLGGKANADPALTQALEDQIMVDPTLSQQANAHSVRPPDEPFQAALPPDAQSPVIAKDPGQTLGAKAAEQAHAAKGQFNGCQLDVAYSMDYANRLPVELPIYPKGQVSEAAGSDTPGCRLRAVTYASPAPLRTLTDFYLTLATRGGFNPQQGSEDGGTLVSGTRAKDGSAFYVILKPQGSGTSADLVTNRGR